MESSPTFSLRVLDTAGQPIETPGEWTPALVEVEGASAADLESIRLMLFDDEMPLRLQKMTGRLRLLADWPRSGPGHYDLKVLHGDRCVGFRLTIRPQKLSPASFSQMLLDLEERFPSAIAAAVQRLGGLSGIELLPPDQSTMAQELVRVRRAIDGTTDRPGLCAVLQDLAQRPHEVLKPVEPWVRAEQARRPHPARLREALSRGYNRTAGGGVKSVLDTRVEHTFDVYENRLVLAYVDQVQRRLAALLRRIQLGDADSSLADDLRSLERRLSRARRQAEFLDEVSLLRSVPTEATMVLLSRPAYRAAFQGFRDFRRNVAVRLEEPRLESPIDQAPALYQLWGTLALVLSLLEAGAELGYAIDGDPELTAWDIEGLCVRVLPNGVTAIKLRHLPTGTRVALIPERTYPRSSGALRSVSYSQRPDVAVEVTRPGGQVDVFVFDPKYKLKSTESADEELDLSDTCVGTVTPGTPKKVDIDKMHAYRDSIRDRNDRRAVQYAAILYPGESTRYAGDLEALQAYPGKADPLFARLREVFRFALANGQGERIEGGNVPSVHSDAPVRAVTFLEAGQ